MVSYVFGLLWLIMYTVIAYGAINYALFKIDPSQFDVQNSSSGVFVFLYYSFHVFLFGSIPEITPIDFYSQLISMSEQFFAIVLLFILIALFIAVRNERYKEQLDRTIREFEETGRALEALIQSTYSMTIEQALREIREMKSNMIDLIVWLSEDRE